MFKNPYRKTLIFSESNGKRLERLAAEQGTSVYLMIMGTLKKKYKLTETRQHNKKEVEE